jgi:hypothetical protein
MWEFDDCPASIVFDYCVQVRIRFELVPIKPPFHREQPPQYGGGAKLFQTPPRWSPSVTNIRRFYGPDP